MNPDLKATARSLGVASLLLFCVGACQSMRVNAEPTLYERLGGRPAIEAVVDDFVARVAADKRINKFFANTDIGRLKANLADQISAAAGGPETYRGGSMRRVHRGMGVQDHHFDALVEDLVKTLDKFEVPEREKSELLAVLGPMRSDIVEPRT